MSINSFSMFAFLCAFCKAEGQMISGISRFMLLEFNFMVVVYIIRVLMYMQKYNFDISLKIFLIIIMLFKLNKNYFIIISVL